jgi:hypothetical protein
MHLHIMGYIMEIGLQEAYRRMYFFSNLEIKYRLKRGSTKGKWRKRNCEETQIPGDQEYRMSLHSKLADRIAIPGAA